MGNNCNPPTGFNASSAASTTSGFTDVTGTTSKVVVVGTIGAGANISVDITGIHNPTSAGVLYARIVTFTDSTGANAYTSATPGTHIDEGGLALSITPTIGVSAAVLESMTFCVSGEAIAENCVGGGASAPALTAPTVKLGNTVGGITVLDAGDVYTGTVNTQISTNAASGAIVSLKSNTTGCGGLVRAGAASNSAGCGIAPALATDITAGEAKFGVRTGTAAGVGTKFNGTYRPFDGGSGAYYSNTVYKLNYASGDGTGVTSTYGDPFLDTNSAPVNNMGMALTFGASAANNTPAGNYSASLSLIATGKF